MIWHYLIWEWKRVFKSPILCLTVLFFPLLIFSLIGLILFHSVQSEVDGVEMIVIDDDDTFETNALIEQLTSDESLNDYITFQKETGSVEAFQDDEQVAAVLHVPDGFTEQLRQGHNQPIQVYLNDGQPFASTLAEMLLASGEGYITAAQSGVNTVLHYSEPDDPQALIQEMTLHFTWLTLGRNDLFNQQLLTDHAVLSWQEQSYLAITSLVLLSTLLFFVTVFRPKSYNAVQDRLYLLGFTPFKQIISQAMFYSSFLFLYTVILVGVTAFWMELNLIFVSIQWFLIILVMILIYLIFEKMLRAANLALITSGFINVVLLVVTGALIPAAYLPSHLSMDWMRVVQDGFYSILNDQAIPYKEWGLLISIVLGLIIILWSLLRGKGERI